MSEFKDFLNEQLKEDEFRKEYDALQPEFDIIRAIVGLNLTLFERL